MDVYVPDGDDTAEFPCPEKFLGGLVVSAVYVKRRSGLVPFYVALVQDDRTGTLGARFYCVAKLVENGESLNTVYGIRSLSRAAARMEDTFESYGVSA